MEFVSEIALDKAHSYCMHVLGKSA